ncbi:GntR family transcriptional regulator [Nesterenkonia sp. CL21]|uniref:GntR family transcriptional regulator n=1 Tax=Nesterenkonia sp. CL21 TaxID=3064894 RepID=UPI00287A7220|nr:GntR family transcriptional regulator [Nesterenkonia sp. CL21]MDS2173179.1 GntR family transcriptional regulator [Nesterenkonia sp. CL21]
MSNPRLPKLNRMTLREQVLESLRDAILTGTFRPGDHLAETELAESYGVSRGTVREALRTLQQAGLVTGDSRGKVRVRTLGAEEIREIFHVRAALETLAAEEIIARGDAATVASELRALLPPARGAAVDYLKRLNLDLAFHQRLCELSDNTTLLETWQGLEGRMRVVMFSPGEGDPIDIMNDDHHAPLVDAIAAEDPAAVRHAFFAHMDEAARRWSS